MLITSRVLSILVPGCGAMLLVLALASPDVAHAQQTFSVDFSKKIGAPNSCGTQERGSGGTYLHCRIVLPSAVPAGLTIRGVFFTCQPAGSAPCQATRECPGGGVCDKHPNPVEPVGFNVAQPGLRAVDWWGWTSDGNDAALHFDVTISP
jgi:hypothetical protein